jgi:uncharacterized protein (DUF983 family)
MAAYLDDDPPGFDDPSDFVDDEGLDPEGPSRADIERFADESRRCPSCGEDVYEDAQLCQVCGHAFEDRPGKTPPWVLIVSAVLLLALLALFVF